jgi:predicted metal-binding membrane protein
MAVLFAVGVMSLFWMALVAAVVFLQKLAPHAKRFESPLAAVLVGVGIWIAMSPAACPASCSRTRRRRARGCG